MIAAPNLINLLGEANEMLGQAGRKSSGRTKASRTTKPSPAGSSSSGKVMQMSHVWITARIRRDLPRWQARTYQNYTRHVFLVTPLQAFEHAEAAKKIIENNSVNDPLRSQQFAKLHTKHELQREFGEKDLDAAEAQYRVSGKPKPKTKPKSGGK